jgi:mitofusin
MLPTPEQARKRIEIQPKQPSRATILPRMGLVRLRVKVENFNAGCEDDSEIRSFNKDDWVVRYPQLKEEPSASPDALRRSLSFADDPTNKLPVRLGLTRAVTFASLSDAKEDETPNPPPLSSDFHVLRLDLKLGSASSANSASSLVSQLEKSSIAHLLDERLATSIAHIDKLRLRVEDTSSKVLVTGDLNAGKSTLVNAILRRQVMPVDQQPCTTAFCEVHGSDDLLGTRKSTSCWRTPQPDNARFGVSW